MKKTAFSLIEISVVLLVIALMAVAITKGSSLIRTGKVASAQSVTASSKVAQINGIAIWLETTTKDSIQSSERINYSAISYWQDISSQYNIAEQKNRLIIVPPDDGKVSYREDGISGLPSLQFTSSGYLTLADLSNGNSNLGSIFVVAMPTFSLSSKMTILDSSSSSSDSNAISISSSLFEIDSAASYVHSTNQFQEGNPYVIGVNVAKSNSRVFINDAVNGSSIAAGDINGFSGLTIGANKSGDNNFTGLISEVIIFDRILSDIERLKVMSYLAKKYSIRVEGAAF